MPSRFVVGAVLWMLVLVRDPARAGTLEIVAQDGLAAPAGRGNYRGFGKLMGFSPAIDGGNVVFGAITDEASGIYALMDGEVIVIADTLTQMPDRDLPFRFGLSGGSGPSISGRNVAFVGVVIAEGEAIWASIDGKLRRIADTATPVPGGIGTFRIFGSGDGVFPTISGENIAFSAGWPREGPEQLGHGVYAYINGEIRLIADTNTILPGVNRRARNFAILGGVRPAISAENVVFAAFIGTGSPPLIGIFGYIDGELRLIVDNRTPVPGREGRTFGGFGIGDGVSPDICGEKIVFSDPFLGIYTWTDGKIEMVADIDTPAPGTIGNFLIFGNANPAIDGDNVCFAARAEGTGSGIFARIDGKLRLIANEFTKVPGREELTFEGFAQEIGVSPDISGETVVFEGLPPDGIYISCPAAPGVPTLSKWGAAATAVLIFAAATGILRIVRPRR